MSKYLVLIVLAMAFFVVPVYAQEPGVITVSGEGIVNVAPDVANVSLGVENQESSPAEAQARNNAIMAEVLSAIKALGVDESDIQTAWFHMSPVHDWTGPERRVLGYMVSNNITVTVRNIDMVGTILAAAAEAGANTGSNVSFGLLDNSEVYNQALALAVADATAKAQTIAQALRVNLGRVAHVMEMGNVGFMPMPVARAGAMMVADAEFGAGVPVQGGELAVTARVQVTFNIIP